MSDHDAFDGDRLRSVDRPRRPDAHADSRIRAEMLAAFDAASAGVGRGDAVADTDDAPVIALEPRRESLPDQPHQRHRRPFGRGWFYLAAAASAVVLGTVALLAGGDDDSGTVADDRAAVVAFCGNLDTLVEDVTDFLAQPGDERSMRALWSLELISQALRDLGDGLSEPLGADVRRTGDVFLEQAAEARGLSDAAGAAFDEALRTLAADLAEEIDRLPNAGGCPTGQMRGTG